MVAAAKLRRAQEAAEAARPYAERMDAVLANLAAGVSASRDGARGCSPAPARSDVHLLVVCTAERGLCGGFNSSIVRLARDARQPAARRGQDGQDPLRRQEGLRHPAPRTSRPQIIERVDLRGVQASSASRNADGDRAARSSTLLRRRRVRRLHAVLLRFQSVISQIPTAQQLIPAELGAGRAAPTGGAVYEYEPDEDEILAELCCRATSRSRSSARCSRTPPPSRARR